MLRWNITVAGVDGGLGQPVGDAVVEAELDERREVEVALARVAEVALIPELHAVRARDVRDGRPHLRDGADLMSLEPLLQRLVEAIDQAGDATIVRAAGGALLHDRDHLVVVRAVDAGRGVRVACEVVAPTGLEEQTVRDG